MADGKRGRRQTEQGRIMFKLIYAIIGILVVLWSVHHCYRTRMIQNRIDDNARRSRDVWKKVERQLEDWTK